MGVLKRSYSLRRTSPPTVSESVPYLIHTSEKPTLCEGMLSIQPPEGFKTAAELTTEKEIIEGRKLIGAAEGSRATCATINKIGWKLYTMNEIHHILS